MGELKATFGGLKLDVEAMFMQMPSVDLDELGGQLEAMHQHQTQQVLPTLCGKRICRGLEFCLQKREQRSAPPGVLTGPKSSPKKHMCMAVSLQAPCMLGRDHKQFQAVLAHLA